MKYIPKRLQNNFKKDNFSILFSQEKWHAIALFESFSKMPQNKRSDRTKQY